MSRIQVTRQQMSEGLKLSPGARHTLVLDKKRIVVVEMDDLNFHFGSSILLPVPHKQESQNHAYIGGLKVVATALQFALDQGKPLLLAGHTDSVGSRDSNVQLSQDRCDNTLLFLTGDLEGWGEACCQYKVEDYQLILKWVANFWSWDCDPGQVDNLDGPKTQNGLKRFASIYQKSFNEELPESTHPSKEYWVAFAKLYEQALLEKVDVASARAALNLLEPATLACGENWPEHGQYQDHVRSKENRRVEFLFFEDTDLPDFNASDPPGYDIYGTDLFFEREYLAVDEDYYFYFSI